MEQWRQHVSTTEQRTEFFCSTVMRTQQTDGSSTAAAPSVTAFTHLAIVWEALLMESERRRRSLMFCRSSINEHLNGPDCDI